MIIAALACASCDHPYSSREDANAPSSSAQTQRAARASDLPGLSCEPTDEQIALAEQGRAKAHEHSAAIALACAKDMMAAKDYPRAANLAKRALREYFDTSQARDLADVAAEAAAEVEAAGAAPTQPAPSVQPLAQVATDKAARPAVGVTDFMVLGTIDIPEAGKSAAELFLAKLPPDKYRLVERARVVELLRESDVTVTQITNTPIVLKDRAIAGVKYLVLGSVNRLGRVIVTARLVDAATGEVVQTAEAKADNTTTLENAMGEVATVLMMDSRQKADYRQAKRMEEGRAAAAQARSAAAHEEVAQRQRVSDTIRRQQDAEAAAVLANARELLDRREFALAATLAANGAVQYSETSQVRGFNQCLDRARGMLTADRAAKRGERDRQRTREMARLQRNASAMFTLATIKVLCRHQEFDKALEAADRAAIDYADTPQASEIAQALVDIRRANQAKSVKEARDDDALQASKKLKSLIGDRKYDEAIQYGTKAAKDYAGTFHADTLGRLLDQARSGLTQQRAAEQKQQAIEALTQIRAFMSRRQYDRAISMAEQALTKYPDTEEVKDISEVLAAARNQQAEYARNRKQEQQAADAMAQINMAMAREDWTAVARLAKEAVETYGQTSRAKEFQAALNKAQVELNTAGERQRGQRGRETGPATKPGAAQAATTVADAEVPTRAPKPVAASKLNAASVPTASPKPVASPKPARLPKPVAATKPAPSSAPVAATRPATQAQVKVATRPSRRQAATAPAVGTAADESRQRRADAALAAARDLMAKGDYGAAKTAAVKGAEVYADTPAARDFVDLAAQAQKGVDALEAQKVLEKHQADARAAVHELRLLMERKEFAKAVDLAQRANNEYGDTPSVRAIIEVLKAAKEGHASATQEAAARRE